MRHNDVEYAVDDNYYPSFEEASTAAMLKAVSCGEAIVDVLVYSEEGARHFGGEDAVERYQEDPEASVFERLEIKVNNVGRVA